MTPPRRREPVFNVPAVVIGLLLGLAGMHVLRLVLPEAEGLRLLGWLAFTPIRLTALIDPTGVAQRVQSWAGSTGLDGERAEIAGFFLSQGRWSAIPTLLTYATLHGGWAHLGLNAIWLLAFGTPVARRFGAARFLLFTAAASIAGALTHWGLFPFGTEPLIGASAGVSGCMGAAVRFAFRTPRLSEEGDLLPVDESLGATFRDRRAITFVVVWFATNAIFGAGSTTFGLTDQPVAWQAHVGGFLVGLLMFPWFDRRGSAADRSHAVTDGEPPLAP